jgi:ABC-type transport system involved in multi-copper enzyme maturation permease subunit
MWLFIFAICFAIQVVIALFSREASDALEAQMFSGFMFVFFFAIAASSTAFSSECEDGTQVRLLSFGVSPSVTLSLKYACVLVVALAMYLALAVAASMLSGESAWHLFFEGGARDFPRWSLLAILGAIAVGVFYSLILTRSLLAVACAAMTVVFGGVAIQAFADSFNLGTSTAVLIAFVAIVALAVINYWLVSRWFRETKQPHSVIEFFTSAIDLRRHKPTRSTDVSITEQAVLADEDLDQPAPTRALQRLHHSWARSTSRTIRFLRWKEAVESRLYFLLASILFALSYLSGVADNRDTRLLFVPVFPFLAGTVALGLCTFRGEQRGQSYRFLTDRGISPSVVWFSTLSVWLPRLLIASGLMFGVFYATSPERYFASFFHACAIGGGEQVELTKLDIFGRTLLVSLLLFGIGQMASLCFTRVLVAVFVAIMLASAAIAWISFSTHFGVPLYLSTLPLVPMSFAVSWSRTRGWMLSDTSFSSWKSPLKIATIGIIAGCVFSMSFRAFEIPLSQPTITRSAANEQQVNGLTVAESKAMFADVTPAENATAELILAADRKLANYVAEQRYQDFSEPRAWNGFDDAWHEWFDQHTETLELLVQAANREECVLESPATRVSDDDPTDVYRMLFLMVLSAAKLQDQGQHAKSLDRLVGALRLCTHFEARASQFAHGDYRVLVALQQWSSHKDVDKVLRNRADKAIQDFQDASPRLEFNNAAEFRTYRNSLREPPRKRGFEKPAGSIECAFWYWLPGEATRRNRLLARFESQIAAQIFEFHTALRSDRPIAQWLTASNSVYDFSAQESRWIRNSPLLTRFEKEPVVPQYKASIYRQTFTNATRLILWIHGEASRTGKLPTTIPERKKGFSRDPWTAKSFIWMPAGVPHPLVVSGYEFPANRPFLMSGGEGNAELVQVAKDPQAPNQRKYTIRFRTNVKRANVFLLPGR